MNIPMLPQMDQHVEVRAESMQINRYTIFFDKEIGDPDLYREATMVLLNASELDSIDMIVNTPGGQLRTMGQIVQSVRHCKAQVRALLTGECHSAGSMLVMNCPEVIVFDTAEMLIHTASFGVGGSTSNVKNNVDFTSKQIDKLIRETYEGFLTEPEMSKVLMGVDLFFNAEQIRKRLQARGKVLAAKSKVSAPVKKKSYPAREEEV